MRVIFGTAVEYGVELLVRGYRDEIALLFSEKADRVALSTRG
jgi:hypothetical protein